jgi:hypothetical protein
VAAGGLTVGDSFGPRDLSAPEQLVLAALLRMAVRLDGKFSDAEREVLEDLALDFGEKTFWQLMDEAGRSLADDEGIRRAALAVENPEARHLIYSCVVSVVQSDSVQSREQGLLDWLVESWRISPDAGPYR